MNKSQSKNSESSTPFDSPRWDCNESPENSTEKRDNSMAIVTVDKLKQFKPEKRPEHRKAPENSPSAAVVMFKDAAATEDHRPAAEDQQPAAKAVPAVGLGERRSRSSAAAEVWKTEETVSKVALGFRLSQVVVCLVSFSVMAADKTKGWSGDSFDRYKEYRYCLSVNTIGFAYSALQACDLTFQLATGKRLISHHLRNHFDFFMDQVLAYLLISASSSAATRVDDWILNWGKDEFTDMATASIGMAFLAFVAFAISSLISGYTLCNGSSM